MGKIFSGLILISILAVLAAPLAVSAQDTPKECCVLRNAVTIEGDTCPEGSVAGPSRDVVDSGGDCEGGAYCEASVKSWGMYCLLSTIYNITDWIFVVMVAIAGLMVIMGAFTLLTAAGSPEKVTSGRNFIMYAAIGLIVGFLARAVPSIVKLVAGI
ncbi:MAG: pilin [bacterium]